MAWCASCWHDQSAGSLEPHAIHQAYGYSQLHLRFVSSKLVELTKSEIFPIRFGACKRKSQGQAEVANAHPRVSGTTITCRLWLLLQYTIRGGFPPEPGRLSRSCRLLAPLWTVRFAFRVKVTEVIAIARLLLFVRFPFFHFFFFLSLICLVQRWRGPSSIGKMNEREVLFSRHRPAEVYLPFHLCAIVNDGAIRAFDRRKVVKIPLFKCGWMSKPPQKRNNTLPALSSLLLFLSGCYR